MTQLLYIAAFYLWLGFTVGYFFRKWLETSFLPRERPGPRGGPPQPPAAP